jgi:transposase
MLRLDEEQDPNILRQAAILLERENKRLVEQIMKLTRELVKLKGGGAEQMRLRIAELERQIAVRNRMLFGPKSEKRGAPEAEETLPEPPKPPQKGHGPKPQPLLPIVEVVHEIPLEERDCKECGGTLEAWEGQFEESEEIDVVERRFEIKKHKRQKYRCRCGECIETAKAPLKLVEGGRYSIDFAIEVGYEKYSEHAPLERQTRKMGREGLDVDSQTLWDQIERVAWLLKPAKDALLAYNLAKPVLGGDETRWPVFGQEKRSTRWHAWALTSYDAVVYCIEDGRSTNDARKLLDGYSGILMCDGYGVYKSLSKGNPGLILVHCWAHVRRTFIDAKEPEKTAPVLDLIGKLYAVEALCPKGPAGDVMRKDLREKRSRAIINEIRELLDGMEVIPDDGVDKAIKYTAERWAALTRFLEDPRIPLDNNHTERALRGPVVGRKNHYGSRSLRGTEVAALYYTLIESAKLNGLDPRAYLRIAVVAALRGERIPLPHEMRHVNESDKPAASSEGAELPE